MILLPCSAVYAPIGNPGLFINIDTKPFEKFVATVFKSKVLSCKLLVAQLLVLLKLLIQSLVQLIAQLLIQLLFQADKHCNQELL